MPSASASISSRFERAATVACSTGWRSRSLSVASREALLANPDWGEVWSRLGLLLGLAALMAWLATRAFGSYQRSL